MRTLALLLILVAVAASRRSRGALLRGQPYYWLSVALASITHCLGN